MYSQHFGLTQDPFSIAPDPRYLFMSERHREALAHLLYGVGGSGRLAGGGFVLLTGDIGTGKTTICRCFLEQVPAGCHVAYIFNPKLTVTELLQSICEEFHVSVAGDGGPPSNKHCIDALNGFLLQSHAAGQSCILIIDEAQNLQSDVLEQLRLLTNLETNARKLLQIVLIGQPELRAMLERPDLEQLAQRVIARFHLDALNARESQHYIAHRLAVAGHAGALPFDAKALQRIHQLARGVPRRINLLCGRALLGAWANGLQRVDRAVVNKAAYEVFGLESVAPHQGRDRRLLYLLGAAVLAGSALAGRTLLDQMPKVSIAPPASRGLQAVPQQTPGAAQITAAASSPVPAASASVASAPAPPELSDLEDIERVLSKAPQDLPLAWRDLAGVWKLPLAGSGACHWESEPLLQCFRATELSLPQLRSLGRPGIVALQSGAMPPVYVVLRGLGDQSALLQVGAVQHRVKLAALARLWIGDFYTFWRALPGYAPDLQGGINGLAIERLAHQLDQVEGLQVRPDRLAPSRMDTTLRARVRAFQRTQGIKADGQPGPLTFMQLESATGPVEVPLISEIQ
ncbi:MAG: AAA family ATPase [Rhodoferax sp.]|nr:AAA family ATPase [Rhodoferax sp.]